MFANETGKAHDSEELFCFIERLVENLSQIGVEAKLGETTLRGCVREILAAGEALEVLKT